MKKYKSVISFTGHSHLHFELQRISEYANIAMADELCKEYLAKQENTANKNDMKALK